MTGAALDDIGVAGFEDAEGITEEQRRNARTARRIRDRLEETGLMSPRMPRYRYWQNGNGPMFCYTTERFEGSFGTFVYKPIGKGARTGQAEEWVLVERLTGRHAKRKVAKARALRLFKRWRTTGRI